MSIVKVLKSRTGETIQGVNRITRELVTKAKSTVKEAKNVLKKAVFKIWRNGQKACSETKRLVDSLKEQTEITERIIQQSRQVVMGNKNISDLIVSFFDPEARPIKRGKLKALTEFGYKLLVQETEEQVIT